MPVTSRRLRKTLSVCFPTFSHMDRGDRQVSGVPRRPHFFMSERKLTKPRRSKAIARIMTAAYASADRRPRPLPGFDLRCRDHGLRAAFDAELLEDRRDMRLDRRFRDAEFIGDL